MPKDTAIPAITTGPLPAARKVHVPGERHPDLRVAMREVDLTTTDEPPLRLYDTSGPYTDPAVTVDIQAGLPPLRAAWIAACTAFFVISLKRTRRTFFFLG